MLGIGNVQSKAGQEYSCFPFLRHIHHAGTVQVIVPQLARAGDIRQMHIEVHVVGVVGDLADAVKIALRICQGGVQLRKLGGVQLFQPCGKEIQFVHVGRQHQIAGQLNRALLRASIVVQEKVLRIVGADADFPQGCLQFFGCGRQGKPKALFALLIKLAVVKKNRKYFAHGFPPFLVLLHQFLHQLVVLHAHMAVIGVRVDVVPAVGAFIERQSGSMGFFPCFLQYIRRQLVAVSFHEWDNIVQAVVVVVAHTGNQLRHVHFLAQIAGIIAVHHNGPWVGGLYFCKPRPVLWIKGVVQIKVKRLCLPAPALTPECQPCNAVPQIVLIL